MVTVNAPITGGDVDGIELSDINYNVGPLSGVGFVRLAVGYDEPPLNPVGTADSSLPLSDPAGQAATNAYITNLRATFATSSAITPGVNRPVGDVTLEETDFDAGTPDQASIAPAGPAGVDGICLDLDDEDQKVDFVGSPTVTNTAGNDTAGPVTISPDGSILRFGTTRVAPPSKTTWTISGILVDTQGGEFGQQTVLVYQCSPNFTAMSIVPDNVPLLDEVNSQNITDYTVTRLILVIIVNAERYAGINRRDTARVISDRGFPCFEDKVEDEEQQIFTIIARDDDFADALTASYIAGQLHAPILLVKTNGPIAQETLDALRVRGVTDVIIMGGVNAVGADVAAQLDALTSFNCGGAARRTPEDAIRTINIQTDPGADPVRDGRGCGRFTFGGNTIGFLDPNDPLVAQHTLRTAILANGRNFPDAMVGGPLAYQGMNDRWFGELCFSGVAALCDGFPILLSDGGDTTLQPDSAALITERNIEQIIIIGGTDAVPQEIEDFLVSQGINVIRLGGDNRRLTAIAVAKFAYNFLGFLAFSDPCVCFFGHVTLARGNFFADALTVGPLSGNDPNNTAITDLIASPGLQPILLTESETALGAETAAFLTELSKNFFGPTGGVNLTFYNGPDGETDTFGFSVFWIDIPGGTAAVSQGVEDEALAALVGE